MNEFIEIMKMVGMLKPLHVRRLQKALREWGANPGILHFFFLLKIILKSKCPFLVQKFMNHMIYDLSIIGITNHTNYQF